MNVTIIRGSHPVNSWKRVTAKSATNGCLSDSVQAFKERMRLFCVSILHEFRFCA